MDKNFLTSAISQGDSYELSFAPGRIEFLGNHLDYNRGTVLGMAIDAGIYCLGLSTGEESFTLDSEGFPNARVKGFVENIEKNLQDNILISAHGNSIRSLLKYLFKIDNNEISKLEIPTGNPLLLKFDKKNLKEARYLDEIRAKDLIKF